MATVTAHSRVMYEMPYRRVIRPIWPLDTGAEPGFVL